MNQQKYISTNFNLKYLRKVKNPNVDNDTNQPNQKIALFVKFHKKIVGEVHTFDQISRKFRPVNINLLK